MCRPGESLEQNEWNPATLDGHDADEAFRLALRDEVQTELDAAEAEERCQDAYLKLLDDPEY